MIRWTRSHRFAPFEWRPGRERRLAWNKRDDRKDDGISIPEHFASLRHPESSLNTQEDTGDVERLRRAVRFTTETITDEKAFLERMTAASEKHKLAEFFTKTVQQKVLKTVFGKQPTTALHLQRLMREDPEAARVKLEHLFGERKSEPMLDTKLAAALKGDEEAETFEGGEEGPSRWDRFLERIGELADPRYTRLAALLANPTLEGLGLPSPREGFDVLRHTHALNPIGLVRKLADALTDEAFLLRGPSDATERLRALRDLSAFILHSLPDFPERERPAILDALSDVQGAVIAMEGNPDLWKIPENADERKTVEQKYAGKHEALVQFLHREREHTMVPLYASGGFVDRLKRAKGEEGDVFDLLCKGLAGGGWIAELPLTDEEKEVCARMALTKVAALYHAVAIGKAVAPSTFTELFGYVKRVFLETSKGVHAAACTELLPVDEAKVLKADIARTIEEGKSPPLSRVRRLRLLCAWLAQGGIVLLLSEEEMRSYEFHAEASIGDLRREAAWRRDALRAVDPDLADASPEDWLAAMDDRVQERMFYESPVLAGDDDLAVYLRTSCTASQLNAIAKEELGDPDATVGTWHASGAFPKSAAGLKEIVDRRGIHPDPDELARQHAYASNELVKREKRENREAALLHESANEAYLVQLNDLIAKREKREITDDGFRMLVEDLNRAYDADNVARHDLHALRLESEMERLFDATAAEGRLRAMELGREHGGRFAAFLETLVRKHGAKARASDEKFLDLSHRIATAFDLDDALRDDLKKVGRGMLEPSADRLTQAQIHTTILDDCGETVREFEKEVEKATARKERARAQAGALLGACGGKKIHSDVRLTLEECSGDDADITSAGVMNVLESSTRYREAFEAMKESEPVRLTRARFEKEAERLKLPRTALAMFDRTHHRIVINRDRTAEMARKSGVSYGDIEDIALIEERRHHFHDVTRELGSQSLLENYRHIAFAHNAPEDFHDDLIALGRRWVRWQEGMTENEWRAEVADELLAKWEVFQHCREKNLITGSGEKQSHVPLRSDEIAFFRAMEAHGIEPLPIIVGSGKPVLEFARPAAALDIDDEEGEGESPERPQEGEPENGYRETATHVRNLRDIQQLLVKIEAFLDHNANQNTPDNRSFLEERKEEYRGYQRRFASDPHSESDEVLEREITELLNWLNAVWKEIEQYDVAQLDTRGAPTRVRGLWAIWNSIEWTSISDFVAIYKAIKEDLLRQFNRRQQGKIGRVGERLTDWLGKAPILKHIPYLQNLASEFHRRDKASEVEEVQKWQEALKDVDSYDLQDMLREIRTGQKDKMKAILNLLSERGRIDWGDKEFWRALNRLSVFEIPIAQCERDENLREEWLRKVIEDIYGDKDHYRNWRNSNSSNIESQKNNYTPEMDRLSNLSGGLDGELEKQLRIYLDVKERRESGETVEMPSAVQPHLYEKVIHYAISNGKMSMEQKFYYLVQGIAHGLLSRDRLAYIAGEGGEGLLQIFPFIDYFYQKNNTIGEIRALAKRLWEGPKGHRLYCKPGLKTTFWLELEVTRMDSVKQRLSKGFTKQGQRMDHDDMHFFLPRVDQKSLVQMMGPAGGGRPQFSPESWENGYVGFSSLLKSLGMLVQLEEDPSVPDAKFTSEDASQAVQGIVNYLTMDSVLTSRTTMSETVASRQSKLDNTRMRTRSPVVSGGKFTTMQAKKEIDAVVREILDAYGLIDLDMENFVFYDAYGNEMKDNKKTEVLLTNLQKRFFDAIQGGGLAPLKRILRDRKDQLRTHAGDYTYEDVRAIKRGQPGQDAIIATAAA